MRNSKLFRSILLACSLVSIPQAYPQDAFEDFFNPAVTEKAYLENNQIDSSEELKTTLLALTKSTSPNLFKEVGTLSYFDHTVTENKVVHAVNYYVPKSYVPDGNGAVLIVLHGGDSSTNTYETARDVSRNYLETFIDFAERNGVILVGPSSSIGWSYNLRILVRQTIDLIKQDLAINPDRIHLWGHSMGAMGLTREAHWLADKGATFLADAGGMQDEYRITPFLNTYFDFRFVHAIGLTDHFQIYVERTRDVLAKVMGIEAAAGMESKYEAHFQERGHNPDMFWTFLKYEGDLLYIKRNVYPNIIHPLVTRMDLKDNPSGPDLEAYAIHKYFWLEVPNLGTDLPRKEYVGGKDENFVSFQARVEDNTYDITGLDPRISKIRVLISSELVDLDKRIKINVNGKLYFREWVRPNAERMLRIARERKDPHFLFENYVDIRIKNF